MRYDYIEPFVNSAVKVLDEVFQSDVVKGMPVLVTGGELAEDILVHIGIEGNDSGSIVFNLDTETALRICSLMAGTGCVSLTTFAADSICELANMIAGNIVSTINDLGYDMRLTTPNITTQGEIGPELAGREIFQVPLFTDLGSMTVNAIMRTN